MAMLQNPDLVNILTYPAHFQTEKAQFALIQEYLQVL